MFRVSISCPKLKIALITFKTPRNGVYNYNYLINKKEGPRSIYNIYIYIHIYISFSLISFN